MRNSLYSVNLEQLKSLFLREIVRGIVVFSLATMLSVTLEVSQGVQSVAAAGNSATRLHQDRRPDRERIVRTTKSLPYILRR